MPRMMRTWDDLEKQIAQDTVDNFIQVVADGLAKKKMNYVDLAAVLGVSSSRASQLISKNTNPSMRYTALVLHRLGYKLEIKRIQKRKVKV